MSAVRDIWAQIRPGRRVGLLNNKLVVPAFSYSCGPSKCCIYFSSINTSAITSNPNFIADSLSQLTLEAWIKIPSYDSVNRPIFTRERLIGTIQYRFEINDGFPKLVLNVGGTTYTYTSTTRVNLNQWTQVGVTFNNTSSLVKYNAQAVTLVHGTETINLTAHGLSAGQTIKFGGTLPSELSSAKTYYVLTVDADSFQISETWNGSVVAFSSNGSAVTITTQTSRIKFYIDAELVFTSDHFGANLTARSNGDDNVAYDPNTDLAFKGHLDEFRIWNVERTKDQIKNAMFSERKPSIDTALIGYFKFKEGSGLLVKEEVNNVNWTLSGQFPDGPSKWVTNDAFPHKFGASFAVARYTVTLNKKISFKYPVAALENKNFALVFAYTDSDGTYKRRYLNKPSGVDFDASVIAYTGEAIPSPFNIEIWNVDGNSTVDLASNLDLKISLTSQPTIVQDQINVAAATLTVDNSLAQAFPWTPFPLTFNSPQTY